MSAPLNDKLVESPQAVVRPSVDPRFQGSSPWHAHSNILLCLSVIVVLSAIFGKTLLDLLRFAARDDLHSYILAVPFVCGFLAWRIRPGPLESPPGPLYPAAVTAALVAGVASVTLAIFRFPPTLALSEASNLSLRVLGYACFVVAAILLCLGARRSRRFAFPLLFLFVLVPLPPFLADGIEIALQRASAAAAHGLFVLSGTPAYREGMAFYLPGFCLLVAEECSGIRSSLVLFVTSLVAGHLFLRTTWRRSVLALAVLPLAVLRNGFRIFAIAMLCLHLDASVIDGPLHHRGGPVFFALSLGPFLFLLWWLKGSELKAHLSRRSEQAAC